MSKRTVEGNWTFARAWLRRRLASDSEGGDGPAAGSSERE
ncbi:MAG: hypothetical protein KF724_08120 [Phycisphaeraceae bacterium]|nr:hypothetical protein [Phycisphaeraceae bacterium]